MMAGPPVDADQDTASPTSGPPAFTRVAATDSPTVIRSRRHLCL
jgi:hypothetical protein